MVERDLGLWTSHMMFELGNGHLTRLPIPTTGDDNEDERAGRVSPSSSRCCLSTQRSDPSRRFDPI